MGHLLFHSFKHDSFPFENKAFLSNYAHECMYAFESSFEKNLERFTENCTILTPGHMGLGKENINNMLKR